MEYNMKKLHIYIDGNGYGGGDDDDDEEEGKKQKKKKKEKKLFSTTAAAIYNHFSIIPFRTLFPSNFIFRHIYI